MSFLKLLLYPPSFSFSSFVLHQTTQPYPPEVIAHRRPQQLMASLQSSDTPPATRPSPDRIASYSNQPTSNSKNSIPVPKRAHTFHSPSPSEKNGDAGVNTETPDTFDTTENNSDNEEFPEIPRASIELDDLPIELITLTDR
jgi:hypothetical protein